MIEKMAKQVFFLIVCDLAAVFAALLLATHLVLGVWDIRVFYIPNAYYLFFLFPVLFYIFDLYFPYKYFSPAPTLIDTGVSVSIGMIMIAAATYADRNFFFSRVIFLYAGFFIICFVFFIRIFYDFVFKSKVLDKRTLIVGVNPLAFEIGKAIRNTPHSGIEIIGMISEKKTTDEKEEKNGFTVLGSAGELLSLLDWYNIQMVVLAMAPDEESSEMQVMTQLLQRRVMVSSAIHLFEKLKGEFPHRLFNSHYMMGLKAEVSTRPYLKLKRILDLCFAGALLVLLSPVLLTGILLLYLSGVRDIFFLQDRHGRDGALFKLIKLRSMTKNRRGRLVVTKLGKFLRRYRIDEIPQLVNVLKGDMGLIGPRPEIPYFVRRCRRKIPFFDMVFALPPGITGWAQVKFRYTTSAKEYERKFRFNLYYIKNVSLTLDLLIILKTLRIVLSGKGE
jgi:exopolysaccharide biosynthesis polyprenyl glycosylphosphotransferase